MELRDLGYVDGSESSFFSIQPMILLIYYKIHALSNIVEFGVFGLVSLEEIVLGLELYF